MQHSWSFTLLYTISIPGPKYVTARDARSAVGNDLNPYEGFL